MSQGMLRAILHRGAKDSDERLVRACLNGDETAWDELIDKYQRLIVSIPVRRGLPPEAVSDIFQTVCLELFRSLGKIREPNALAGWLIRVTANECYQWRRRENRYVEVESDELESDGDDQADLLNELEGAQILRESITLLPERCRRLVHLLFFETPPRPYDEVAKRLGIARGSMSATRQRCLSRLRRTLEDREFT